MYTYIHHKDVYTSTSTHTYRYCNTQRQGYEDAEDFSTTLMTKRDMQIERKEKFSKSNARKRPMC